MSYHVVALTKDRAKLIVHTLVTSDPVAAEFVAAHWRDLGFLVRKWEKD